MNDSQVRKADKLGREDAFINDNAVDFPTGSVVRLMTQEINTERQKILQYDAQQFSGFSGKRQAQAIYDARRDELIDLLDKFVMAAAIVDDNVEGTAAKFKHLYPRTDQRLIAAANSFSAEAAAIRAELIEAGLEPEDFTALTAINEAFQEAAAAHDLAEETQAEATGGMADSFRKAMDLSNRRDKRVRMKYRKNPSKLAAWAVASHLDRAPKRLEVAGITDNG